MNNDIEYMIRKKYPNLRMKYKKRVFRGGYVRNTLTLVNYVYTTHENSIIDLDDFILGNVTMIYLVNCFVKKIINCHTFHVVNQNSVIENMIFPRDYTCTSEFDRIVGYYMCINHDQVNEYLQGISL